MLTESTCWRISRGETFCATAAFINLAPSMWTGTSCLSAFSLTCNDWNIYLRQVVNPKSSHAAVQLLAISNQPVEATRSVQRYHHSSCACPQHRWVKSMRNEDHLLVSLACLSLPLEKFHFDGWVWCWDEVRQTEKYFVFIQVSSALFFWKDGTVFDLARLLLATCHLVPKEIDAIYLPTELHCLGQDNAWALDKSQNGKIVLSLGRLKTKLTGVSTSKKLHCTWKQISHGARWNKQSCFFAKQFCNFLLQCWKIGKKECAEIFRDFTEVRFVSSRQIWRPEIVYHWTLNIHQTHRHQGPLNSWLLSFLVLVVWEHHFWGQWRGIPWTVDKKRVASVIQGRQIHWKLGTR